MRLIDADALDEVVLDLNENKNYGITRGEYKLIDAVLFEFPTIEERKVGKWRYSRNISSISYSDMMITCDQCGYTKERCHGDVFNFCPSCGARMHELETESRDYENKGDDD